MFAFLKSYFTFHEFKFQIYFTFLKFYFTFLKFGFQINFAFLSSLLSIIQLIYYFFEFFLIIPFPQLHILSNLISISQRKAFLILQDLKDFIDQKLVGDIH